MESGKWRVVSGERCEVSTDSTDQRDTKDQREYRVIAGNIPSKDKFANLGFPHQIFLGEIIHFFSPIRAKVIESTSYNS